RGCISSARYWMSAAISAASTSSGPGPPAIAPGSPSERPAAAPQGGKYQQHCRPVDQIQEQLRMAAVETAAGLRIEGHIHNQLVPIERCAGSQAPPIGR